MSSTNSTLEDFAPPAKLRVTPFIALIVVALIVCAVALVQGDAPFLDPHPIDWVNQARAERTWAGVFACGVFLFLIGFIGTIRGLIPSRPQQPKAKPAKPRPTMEAIPLTVVPAAAVETPIMSADDTMTMAAQRAPEKRGSLAFDASRLSATRDEAVETVEMPSLEPAIFHDNASDSFLSRDHAQEPISEAAAAPTFDADAALSETHGLNIARPESAQIIPIRPDIAVAALEAAPVQAAAAEPTVTVHDPLEAALLAEPMTVPRAAPQSDISAVINSAMRFIDSPSDSAPVEAIPVEAIPVEAVMAQTVETPSVEPSVNGEAEVRQAVQTALSVWPDSTRAIAADELSVRISHLYYDPAPQSAQIFKLIASGDLGAASAALQAQSDVLATEGRTAEAAELWRVCGALHMGRDDSKALAAYEKVSELDPSDANIHLYLTRRYQMSGDTAKLPPVIGRALAVISDPSVRSELLTPYADLQMKAGNVQAAGDALEELTRLHEMTAYLRPDDIAARSAHAITVARLAQAREMQGAFDQAGPLYKKAHQVFSDLSAMKPEHPGLRAMAENALKDARRFGA